MASRLFGFFMRHRSTILNLSLLVAILAVVAFVGFEIDVFFGERTASPSQRMIDLNETLLLGGVLCIGLLLFAWHRVSEVKREIAKRLRSEQEFRILASEDPLTGLANRRRFTEALNEALGSPPSHNAWHALVM